MQATQKNDYDITVMRGPSVSELILSPEPILFTGVERPDVIVALAPEGVMRKRELFAKMSSKGRVILAKGVGNPRYCAPMPQKSTSRGMASRRTERALAALSLLAREPKIPSPSRCSKWRYEAPSAVKPWRAALASCNERQPLPPLS